MYLYSRTVTARRERLLDATTWAADIAGTVSNVTGLEVGVWSVVFGAPINTITWTAVIDAPAVMAAAGDKLLADPTYVAAVEGAAELFDSAPEDSVVELLATPGDGGHGGDYASMVTATCAGGHIVEAITWGIEMANHAQSVTGRDGAFGRSLYGTWGSVGWISMAATAEEIDAAQAALNADPTYIERVDRSVDLFEPGSGHARLSRRIA